MTAPLIRIGLRYLCGYLVLISVMPRDIADMIANDQDVALVIGAVIAAGVEGIYALAKRYGWTT